MLSGRRRLFLLSRAYRQSLLCRSWFSSGRRRWWLLCGAGLRLGCSAGRRLLRGARFRRLTRLRSRSSRLCTRFCGSCLDLWLRRWRRFRRKICWRRSLLRKFLFQLLRLRCWDILPPAIDLSFSKLLGKSRLLAGDRVQLRRRSNNIELVSLHRGFESRGRLGLRSIVHLISLQRVTLLLRDLCNGLVLRAIVVNDRIVVRNVSNVCCPIDDRHVLLWRQIVSSVGWSPEIMERDERERYWADVEVGIAPRRNADADANGAFGRKRRPPTIVAIITLPPGYPRRRPLVARNPDPANA